VSISRVEQFGSTITRTRWWRTVADGYCADRNAPGETATLTLTRRMAHPKGLSVVGLVPTIDSNSYLWPLAIIAR